jgi:hypothetical protein
LLYGQLGKTDLMIEMFLDEAEAHPENSIIIQNQFMGLWLMAVMPL